MWTLLQITVEIEEVDGSTMMAVIQTPVGTLRALGRLSIVGRTLLIEEAHVDGLSPGALNRAGINAICRKLLEEAGVEKVVIKGSARSTGKNPGKRPRPFCFPQKR
jgi:hypothetical protein